MNYCLVIASLHRNAHLTTGWCVFDAIIDKIHQHSLQLQLIAVDDHRIQILTAQFDIVLSGKGLQVITELAANLGQIYWLKIELKGSDIGPGEQQQTFYQHIDS